MAGSCDDATAKMFMLSFWKVELQKLAVEKQGNFPVELACFFVFWTVGNHMVFFGRGSRSHMGDSSLEVYAFFQIASMLTPLLLIDCCNLLNQEIAATRMLYALWQLPEL